MYGIDEYLDSARSTSSSTVEVNPPTVDMTDEIQQKLSAINSLSDSTLIGVDLYIAALTCFYCN